MGIEPTANVVIIAVLKSHVTENIYKTHFNIRPGKIAGNPG